MKYFAKNIKGKLMLITSDIQVGDDIWYKGLSGKLKQGKFYHLTKGSENEDIIDLTPNGEGTGIDYSMREEADVFKVVGEISQEALTYCKEGMEFEGEGIDFTPAVSDKDYEEGRTDRIFYMIKGPCGHFH